MPVAYSKNMLTKFIEPRTLKIAVLVDFALAGIYAACVSPTINPIQYLTTWNFTGSGG